jgi:hypothetical protein
VVRWSDTIAQIAKQTERNLSSKLLNFYPLKEWMPMTGAEAVLVATTLN